MQNQTIEQRLDAIESKNKRVELDKKTAHYSFYLHHNLFVLKFIVGIDPFVNAIVPTIGFLLSTLTLPYFKKLWLRKESS